MIYGKAFRNLSERVRVFLIAVSHLQNTSLIGAITQEDHTASQELGDREFRDQALRDAQTRVLATLSKLKSTWNTSKERAKEESFSVNCERCARLEDRVQSLKKECEDSQRRYEGVLAKLAEARRNKRSSYVLGETDHTAICDEYLSFQRQILHPTAIEICKELSTASNADPPADRGKLATAAMKSVLIEQVLMRHYADQCQKRARRILDRFHRLVSDPIAVSLGFEAALTSLEVPPESNLHSLGFGILERIAGGTAASRRVCEGEGHETGKPDASREESKGDELLENASSKEQPSDESTAGDFRNSVSPETEVSERGHEDETMARVFKALLEVYGVEAYDVGGVEGRLADLLRQLCAHAETIADRIVNADPPGVLFRIPEGARIVDGQAEVAPGFGEGDFVELTAMAGYSVDGRVFAKSSVVPKQGKLTSRE